MTNAIDGPAPGMWRRMSFCQGGECLEVAQQGQMILIRDSKDLSRLPLRLTRQEFKAFADGIKAGELDDLL
jgi:Domain of unknown function (DUF397)